MPTWKCSYWDGHTCLRHDDLDPGLREVLSVQLGSLRVNRDQGVGGNAAHDPEKIDAARMARGVEALLLSKPTCSKPNRSSQLCSRR